MNDTLIAFIVALLRQGCPCPEIERAIAAATAQTPVHGDAEPLRHYAQSLAQRLCDGGEQ
jgi:hypothetical protein